MHHQYKACIWQAKYEKGGLSSKLPFEFQWSRCEIRNQHIRILITHQEWKTINREKDWCSNVNVKNVKNVINVNCWEWEIVKWEKEITMWDHWLVFLSPMVDNLIQAWASITMQVLQVPRIFHEWQTSDRSVLPTWQIGQDCKEKKTLHISC